jgi:hypothetical protein
MVLRRSACSNLCEKPTQSIFFVVCGKGIREAEQVGTSQHALDAEHSNRHAVIRHTILKYEYQHRTVQFNTI